VPIDYTVVVTQGNDPPGLACRAAASIPAEVCARLEAAAELNDEDRETIIEIARKSLARFQATPEATPGARPKPGGGSRPDAPTRDTPTPEGNATAKPRTEPTPPAEPREES
jgi:hypothetical protein